jgi:chaperonin GroES
MAKQSSNPKIDFQPAGDRVLVKPESSKEEKSPSGLYIPDSAKSEERRRGTIVAIGRGSINSNGQLIPIQFKVGDSVLFRGNEWDKEELRGQEYYLIPESSILGIFK